MSPFPKRIELVCISDSSFCFATAAMLRSVLQHLHPESLCHVTVLDNGMSDERWARLSKLACARLTLTRAKVKSDSPAPHFLKLTIPECLPPETVRAIYLDSDLLVLSDLTELWQTPLGGLPVGAVRDGVIPSIGSPRGLPVEWRGGRDPSELYFNSGVLVFDLALWRSRALGEDLLRFSREHSRDFRYFEQDALNARLGGSIFPLDESWNWIHSARRRGGGAGRAKARILHFAGRFKPWSCWPRSRDEKLFFRILDQTPWRGWRSPVNRAALVNSLYLRCLRPLLSGLLRPLENAWFEFVQNRRVAR